MVVHELSHIIEFIKKRIPPVSPLAIIRSPIQGCAFPAKILSPQSDTADIYSVSLTCCQRTDKLPFGCIPVRPGGLSGGRNIPLSFIPVVPQAIEHSKYFSEIEHFGQEKIPLSRFIFWISQAA